MLLLQNCRLHHGDIPGVARSPVRLRGSGAHPLCARLLVEGVPPLAPVTSAIGSCHCHGLDRRGLDSSQRTPSTPPQPKLAHTICLAARIEGASDDAQRARCGTCAVKFRAYCDNLKPASADDLHVSAAERVRMLAAVDAPALVRVLDRAPRRLASGGFGQPAQPCLRRFIQLAASIEQRAGGDELRSNRRAATPGFLMMVATMAAALVRCKAPAGQRVSSPLHTVDLGRAHRTASFPIPRPPPHPTRTTRFAFLRPPSAGAACQLVDQPPWI